MIHGLDGDSNLLDSTASRDWGGDEIRPRALSDDDFANALCGTGEGVIGREKEDVQDEFRREEAQEKLERER